MLLALTLLSALASAATVDPDLVSDTLPPGEATTLDVLLTRNPPPPPGGGGDDGCVPDYTTDTVLDDCINVGSSGPGDASGSLPPIGPVTPPDTTIIPAARPGCPVVITFDPPGHPDVLSGETVSFAETIAVPLDISEEDLDDGLAACVVDFRRAGLVIASQDVLIDVPLSQPPVAVCVDATVQADPRTCLADADVDDGSYDPDGGAVTTAASPAGPYGAGAHTVTLTVTDEEGETDSCEAIVTVEDTTPPVVEVGPMSLWPPNHELLALDLAACGVTVTDACGGSSEVGDVGVITEAWSDEPEDARGGGDGHTLGDLSIDGPTDLSVRAERQGGGNGRVYGIAFEVADDAGNLAVGTCHVGVPHNLGGGAPVDDGAVYTITGW